MSVLKTSNKYSKYKIVWFPEKLESLRNNIITAPIYARMKPTNFCCHNCHFCVYNHKISGMHNNMKKERLSKEKIFEVLDDFKEMEVKCVTYSGGGESLMHPDIADIMERTLKNNIDLSIITNGQLLSGRKASILSVSKWVRISMDYFDAASFIESRGCSKKDFDEILDNIINFSKQKEDSCDLSINFIITNKNYNKIYDVCNLLKILNIDNIRFSPVWVKNFLTYHEPLKNEVYKQLKLSRQELETDSFKIYDSYNFSENIIKRQYKKCFIMQINPVIGADGNIYNCHNKSYTTEGIIGNINQKRFKDVWFSDEAFQHFNKYNAKHSCNGQCANDGKNLFIHELIDCHGDNYV